MDGSAKTDYQEQADMRRAAITNLFDIYADKIGDALGIDGDQLILFRQGLEALMLPPQMPPFPPMPQHKVRCHLFMHDSMLYDWIVYSQAVSEVEFSMINDEPLAIGSRFEEAVWELRGPAAEDYKAFVEESRAEYMRGFDFGTN